MGGPSLTAECELSGAGVLVTRAVHQAEPLCQLISRLGGVPQRLPAVEIGGPAAPERLQSQLAEAGDRGLWIFVSPNAVEWGLKLFPQGLPATVEVAAVGGRTAELLRQSGCPAVIVPATGSDSEALLAMPQLQQVDGRQVMIFRGDGGRTLLADQLSARGARVAYVEVYRRLLPEGDHAALIADWHRLVDLVTVTSNDLLDNLFTLLGSDGEGLLRTTPVIVISERMEAQARMRGCETVIRAAGADLSSLQQAICSWSEGR